MHGLVILGDQLYPDSFWERHQKLPVFMAEDFELCTHFKYHKHKLVFFLASMRRFAGELKAQGFDVHYHELNDETFLDRLSAWVKKLKLSELTICEVDDMFFETRLEAFATEHKLKIHWLASPKFLTKRADFALYSAGTRRPFMKTFYEGQRKKTGLLMDGNGKPLGGQYSFDADNRKKLPKNITPPPLPQAEITREVEEVAALVEAVFSDHPGDTANFWLATSRSEAKNWAGDFFKHRMELFGDYEDALSREHDFVFHSILSPYMNIGFLPPEMLMAQVPKLMERKMPLNSVEGFVRQVIGWREFIHGVYRQYDGVQREKNFFQHKRRLTKDWYDGTTGVVPLDDAIKKTQRLGFAHHIERLMVLSNMMLLSEIHPHDVYRWFMEMFVDSADWVMGPNVWGMGQFSDGGIFATKPYICGSNYIRKMSDYPAGDWCDVMDGLYWRFMEKHREFFTKNARMGAAMGSLDKMDPARRKKIFTAAEAFLQQKTAPGAL
jgi:deoxyribodipyrimidine photolyase-related protein